VKVLTLRIALAGSLLAAGHQPQRPYSTVPGIARGTASLWTEPALARTRDLRYGVGGAQGQPRAPFTFLKGDDSGTTPKVLVRDAAGRQWSVKFGKEVSADVFGAHLAWALGYYAEPTYYVARGRFRNAKALHGLEDYIDATGRFEHARFQLRSRHPEYLPDVGWSWAENPFVGTRQLNGLKILMMLLSNWDNKDIDDAVKRGSNTAIYRERRRYAFFVNDWGAALGGWGRGPTRYVWYITRSKWDCQDFSKDTRKFIEVKDGRLDWGYKGRHSDAMMEDVTARDIGWLMQYLGRLTDGQIRGGLLASGATAEEASCYTEALRMRIRDLAGIPRVVNQKFATLR
jgi:hypothetical protein